MIRTKTRQLILRHTKNLVDQEGKGDQDTTTDNEWEHLRNPTHQVFVESSTQAQFFLASASLCCIFSVEDICFSIQDGLDQFFCLTDTGCDWFRDQFLPSKRAVSTALSAAMMTLQLLRFLQLSSGYRHQMPPLVSTRTVTPISSPFLMRASSAM